MAVNKVVYNGNTLVDLTSDTVAADKMLSGYTAHDKSGAAISGSMANNGAMNKTMDGVNTKSVSVPAGYTSGGTVSMDSTVDDAVTAAITALTDKGVTVPDGTNVTGLADLIAAIESGGATIVTGTVTTTDESFYCVEHGLGLVPRVFAISCQSVPTTLTKHDGYFSLRFINPDSCTETSMALLGHAYVGVTGASEVRYNHAYYSSGMGQYSGYKILSDTEITQSDVNSSNLSAVHKAPINKNYFAFTTSDNASGSESYSNMYFRLNTTYRWWVIA